MTDSVRCKLFGETLWISPYVFSSFVALHEKGIPFDIVEVALAEGAHLHASYRDTSLTARVPAFEHNGFSLADTIPFERDGIGAGHDRTTSAGDRGTHSNCSPGGQRAAGTALKRHVACR